MNCEGRMKHFLYAGFQEGILGLNDLQEIDGEG